MTALRYLLTGTGRCGTGFVARLLTSAGAKCTHEQIFNTIGWDHAVEQMRLMEDHPEWGWVADASWAAVPWLDRPELADVAVVHLVRDPKKVIDSWLRQYKRFHPYYGPYWRWAESWIAELGQWDRPEDKCAARYVAVNEMIAGRADVLHPIEHDPAALLVRLGIDGWQECDLFNDPEHNAHPGVITSDVKMTDFADLLQDPLARMSRSYGYRWEDI